jgi:hypothetical protein
MVIGVSLVWVDRTYSSRTPAGNGNELAPARPENDGERDEAAQNQHLFVRGDLHAAESHRLG